MHSLLDKAAAEAISGLKLTSANYQEAIDILKYRFGNQQQIVNAHMNALLNLPKVTNVDDLKSLRQLHDKVESHMRGLKSLEVDSGSYGSLLTPVLVEKLPKELRLEATRKLKENWGIDELVDIFKEELEARERASLLQGSSKDPPPKPPFKHRVPTVPSLFASGAGPTCTYCKKAHPSNSCSTVTDKNERKEILKRSGRCYICLKKNHVARECKSKMKCFKCDKRHHISICPSNYREQPTPPEQEVSHPPHPPAGNLPTPPVDNPPVQHRGPQQVNQIQQQPENTHVNMFVDAKSSILLQTARATVYNPNDPSKFSQARLIFDTGSQRSYITSVMKESLNLPILRRDTLKINAFGSRDDNMTSCNVVQFHLGTERGQKLNLSAYVVPLICSTISNQNTRFAQQSYEHLSGLKLADSANDGEEFDLDILIGSDCYWQLVTGHVIHGNDGPTAMHTRLGWVLSGPVKGVAPDSQSNVNIASTHVLRCSTQPCPPAESTIEASLKRFWELESLGISPNEHSVYEEFLSTVTHRDGRYEVHLPWKDSQVTIPDNYQLSLKRLEALLRRMRQDPKTLKEYDNIIHEQLARGIIERVDETSTTDASRVHYLPHHAIIRRDKKTTKLRIVYDASAKSDGPSLNDCLYSGPSLAENIVDILLRFRCHPTALVGDIEKAFLMISIAKEDRDALRFLWIDDVNDDDPKVVIYRFTRVVFGVTASPFLLNGTIKHHIEKYLDEDPEFVKKFLSGIYVDDLSSGGEDDDAAYELYVKSKQRLNEGGFNLRKFLSNSPTLMERIQQNEDAFRVDQSTADVVNDVCTEDKSYSKSTVGNPHEVPLEREEKILGIRWNYVSDTFIFNFQRITQAARELKPTKRNVIGIISRFYDPLGVLAPVTVKLKMFFQELCQSKVEWDEELMSDLKKKWEHLIVDLEGIESTVIPRCYRAGIEERVLSYSLQGFCDASLKAYGAVVYLKMTTSLGTFLRFVIAKTRVSPINKQSIPRLELLSAVVLARLISTVTKALNETLKLDDPTCWTDSKVSLYWIHGETQEWKQFVQNRVLEIRKLVPINCWRHCPGKVNPADLASRGITSADSGALETWLKGPEWMLNDIGTETIEIRNNQQVPEECITEMKVKDRQSFQKTCSLVCTEASYQIQNVIDVRRFSSFQKLITVTSMVLRFVRRSRKAHLKEEEDKRNSEAEIAENIWFKQIQLDLQHHPSFENWRKQFGLFWDKNGIIRCMGRISKANLPDETKHPILLNAKSKLTELIVRESHNRVYHNGVKETLTELRSRFWIIRGRQFVRKVIHSCVICKKHEGKPYALPASPPLPDFRIQQQPPFTSTGVDFAGPLYVKDSKKGKTLAKTWIALYTCAVTRALHLELVSSMTSESFLLCFRRFCARRGLPKRMISDNAKTFVTASRRLKALFQLPEVRQHMDLKQIKWSFNTPKAPWQGGFFERLVKSVKRCLKKILGRACVTYEELLTILTEIECVLNSRPLTYVSTEDLEEPLTPSHLLCGRRLLSVPYGDIPEATDPDWDPKSDDLTRRVVYLQRLIDKFWNRWSKEYLLELRESHRNTLQDSSPQEISVGEMVVVHDDNQRRGLWNLGKIEKLIEGEDHRIRSAVVRVHGEGRKTKTLKRPINKLYSLEVRSQDEDKSGSVNVHETQRDMEPEPTNDQRELRPRRKAALKADILRKQWIADEYI